MKKIKKTKDFSAKILKLMASESKKTFNYKQIATALDVKDTKGRNEIIKDLLYLKSNEKIEELTKGKKIVLEQKTTETIQVLMR